MRENKTGPTTADVGEFLAGLTARRRTESEQLIALMQRLSGQQPVLWGPSIIGFGSMHYRYDTGREGDVPRLSFSPRKATITVYFSEGFDRYADLLARLGRHRISVSCLYLNKLVDADLEVLTEMLARSLRHHDGTAAKPTTVGEYLASVPEQARPALGELRSLVRGVLPGAEETLSYGVLGYRTAPKKRAPVHVSGWKDHVALYPVPADEALAAAVAPYRRGKGTLWFPLDEPLPAELITRVVTALAQPS
ncbi:DUF1801 domain-containing protein [Enemella dayhoffiae]|uniref:DUF1801 domain-containing protein n=1 Tax=Enemella dayhoffiae TaxID=2016507 RepID=UPI001595F39E|nr:DUF1801 domain-containing protein [Enemella dayhoffiae]